MRQDEIKIGKWYLIHYPAMIVKVKVIDIDGKYITVKEWSGVVEWIISKPFIVLAPSFIQECKAPKLI